MTAEAPRSATQRKEDTLAMLQEPGIDVWVATASLSEAGAAHAHMVPLSLAWIDECVVIAVESDSVTCHNISEHRQARLGIGPTRDVVVIDAVLDEAVPVEEVPDLADAYASQADWDPRSAGDSYVFVKLRPQRVQAWREANEIAGRTLMRGGTWLV
jgi:hypothetical protein